MMKRNFIKTDASVEFRMSFIDIVSRSALPGVVLFTGFFITLAMFHQNWSFYGLGVSAYAIPLGSPVLFLSSLLLFFKKNSKTESIDRVISLMINGALFAIVTGFLAGAATV